MYEEAIAKTEEILWVLNIMAASYSLVLMFFLIMLVYVCIVAYKEWP